MSETPRLEMKHLGPFIDYGALSRELRRSGRVVVSVDEDARQLLEEWCKLVGARISVVSEGLYSIEATGEVPRRKLEEAGAPTAPVGPAAAAAPAASRWRSDISEMLADPTKLLTIILRSKPLYRGGASAALEDVLRKAEKALVRASIGGTEYIVVLFSGEVVAGAAGGKPLAEEEAKKALSMVLSGSAARVAVYDASQAL